MDRESSPATRRAGFVLMAIASIACEIAAEDTRDIWHSVALASGWIFAAFVLCLFARRPADPLGKPPIWVMGMLVLALAAPMIVEPIQRNWTGGGSAMELLMVYCLRSLGLSLVVCGGWNRLHRLSGVVSLFLMLFSGAITNHEAVLGLLVAYAVVGCVWLIVGYQSTIQTAVLSKLGRVRFESTSDNQRLPWGALSLLIVTLIAVGCLFFINPSRLGLNLGEWMPTSGGTGETDPFARFGMGDGPEEQAGERAKAAGMVETDRMIEDNKNSLLDAVSDMYGPPHKPPKDQDRTIAVGMREIIQNHGKLPENRRPSRTFETSRKGPERDPKKISAEARSLFEIEGRTPLHVRLVAYDRYDADEKKWMETNRVLGGMIESADNGWFRPSNLNTNSTWYREDERHRFKTAEIDDNLVPAPTMLSKFKIKGVDRADYFEWQRDGVLGLAGRQRTPPGVVINTECRTVDPWIIPASSFVKANSGEGVPKEIGEVPASSYSEFQKLGREWAGHLERGWPQVDTCLRKFRSEYTVDPQCVPPEDHPSPELWFLLESRRGPDYLFASSLALILRTLDYPTRVCLGYYASPEAFDAQTGHTPIQKTDLHTWAELKIRDGHWIVLEPSPGYEVLAPKIPLIERFWLAILNLGRWSQRHFFEILLGSILVAGCWLGRREIVDKFATMAWRYFPTRNWRTRVLRASAILERRGRYCGLARPTNRSTACWLRSISISDHEMSERLSRFASLTEWAAFSRQNTPPWDRQEILELSGQVLNEQTLRSWKQISVSNYGRG